MENKAPLSGWERIGVTGRGRAGKWGGFYSATSCTPDDPQHYGRGGGVEPQGHQDRERLLWVWRRELKGV